MSRTAKGEEARAEDLHEELQQAEVRYFAALMRDWLVEREPMLSPEDERELAAVVTAETRVAFAEIARSVAGELGTPEPDQPEDPASQAIREARRRYVAAWLAVARTGAPPSPPDYWTAVAEEFIDALGNHYDTLTTAAIGRAIEAAEKIN